MMPPFPFNEVPDLEFYFPPNLKKNASFIVRGCVICHLSSAKYQLKIVNLFQNGVMVKSHKLGLESVARL